MYTHDKERLLQSYHCNKWSMWPNTQHLPIYYMYNATFGSNCSNKQLICGRCMISGLLHHSWQNGLVVSYKICIFCKTSQVSLINRKKKKKKKKRQPNNTQSYQNINALIRSLLFVWSVLHWKMHQRNGVNKLVHFSFVMLPARSHLEAICLVYGVESRARHFGNIITPSGSFFHLPLPVFWKGSWENTGHASFGIQYIITPMLHVTAEILPSRKREKKRQKNNSNKKTRKIRKSDHLRHKTLPYI